MGKEYQRKDWIKAADLFDKCGDNVEHVVASIVKYCCDNFDEMNNVPNLFLENARYASEAYRLVQGLESMKKHTGGENGGIAAAE